MAAKSTWLHFTVTPSVGLKKQKSEKIDSLQSIIRGSFLSREGALILSPVQMIKVTLNKGPFHVASQKFFLDCLKNYI